MHILQRWSVATRLATISLAIASTGLGSALAAFTGKFSWWVSILSMLTASLLQIICNLSNDYGDFVQGADCINQVKPPSAIQTGLVTLHQVRRAVYWGGVAVAVVGATLLYQAALSWIAIVFFSILGVLAVVAAITYTIGSRPYGYRGWGDAAVFIFFGVIGVVGTCYLHTKQLSKMVIFPAISYGSLVVSVLNINNIRDMHTDIQAGKHTIPVRIGRKAALYYHWSLLAISIVTVLVFLLHYVHTPWPYACLCTIPWLLQHGVMVGRQDPAQLTEQLQSLVRITLCFVLLLSFGMLLESSFVLHKIP